MKKIHFNKITIQNFLSIGNKPVEIEFLSGVNLITGENLDNIGSRNGIGKSSIMSAIYWIIFGETIQDLKKTQIKNNKTDGKCFGELDLIVNGENYTIKRDLDPSKISIYKQDVDITLSTIEKNNEFIQNLIGLNREVFKNTVILTTENTIPFLAQNKINKRKFIEGVLDLNIFNDILLQVRKDYNEEKKEFEITVKLFENENNNIERLKKQKDLNLQKRQEKIKHIEQKINELLNNIKSLNEKNQNFDEILEKIEKTIQECELKIDKNSDFSELEDKILHLSNKKTEISTNIIFLKNEYNKLKENSNICPTCKRPFSEKNDNCEVEIKNCLLKIENFKKELDKVENEESNLKTNLTNIKDNIKLLKNKIVLLKKQKDEVLNISNKILEFKKEIKNLEQKIEEIRNENDSTDDLIKESNINLDSLNIKIKEKSKKLELLDNAKILFSEDGIKALIIKNILNFLNQRLNFYLSSLEAPCLIKFNETFDCDVVTVDGKPIDYWNMSGGERKRTDTAIIFTFQDLLNLYTGVDFNLNIFDEWADSALDEKGLIKFLEILKTRVFEKNQSIYVIGHSPNLSKFGMDNIILLEKKDGITSLKN